MRVTLRDIRRMRDGGERIAMVTAYDHASAVLAERVGGPMLVVGDSLGMVVRGHGSTLPVALDDIAPHTAAVVRGSALSLVVADLPFLTSAGEGDAVASALVLEPVPLAAAVMARLSIPTIGIGAGASCLPSLAARLIDKVVLGRSRV